MDLRNIRFGIEIETVKRTREHVAQAIQSVVGGHLQPGPGQSWLVHDLQQRT